MCIYVNIKKSNGVAHTKRKRENIFHFYIQHAFSVSAIMHMYTHSYISQKRVSLQVNFKRGQVQNSGTQIHSHSSIPQQS